MSNCDTCPTKDNCSSQEGCMIENNPYNEVKKVIAVMSGKGGVGKSTIATLIAKTLRKKGYTVGILDSDVTGPSIPRLMGVNDKKVGGSELGIIPVKSPEGISVMSLNFLMENEEEPVIWRGPILAGTVKQFWTDVYWGNLDYLVIDMPPGTGDVPLTVMQSIPINGMVMVSTPHDMVSMIVAKSINMAKKMNIPIVGIVENMSYILCPDCGKEIRFFDNGDIKEYLDRMDIGLLGELPMTQEIAHITDKNASYEEKVFESMSDIVDKIIKFD
ncbi:Mrp/NBP35 family ATP-binding protein [Clostridiisalibacter paucivorans]|uniref:Mrp/NBP35 family ATP-binding protein n=1 Tax=Clostridiisalibacter paucivorans TaxID=408753 RepID=UPI0004793545|nr:Mrp/NBP35 family ATP-binding protein [Clostridiisalibacter paucivorans]